MSSINFDNAYLLLIAIPLAALLLVPFFLAVRKDNANGHNIASCVIHVVMAILIAFTAAGTTIVTTVTETNVYVVADVSYSADKNLDTVDEYIRNVNSALPNNSRMGVICFGKDYKLITRLGERFRTVKNAGVDNTETNIVEALNYAGTLFREGVIKRVVLITDGKQSYEGDSGALKRAVDGLIAKNIKVDAMFLDDNITVGESEVQLSDVEFADTVYQGHRETATAVIRSSYEVRAIVELYKGTQLLAERALDLTVGTNSVTFNELDTAESGTYDYEVRVRASGDTNTFNNNFYFTQKVTDNLNILVITDSADDATVIKSMYGENAVIDTYVDVTEVPGSIEALCKYDEIVLSNVDLRKMSNYAKFLESLDVCVSLFGKSLLTFGNVYVQDCESNELEVLDKMLPVNFGNANRDSKLYTILIDASRSMGFLSKLTRAKLAACKLVDLLNDKDKVCIVEFHGDVQRIQPLTDAVNRDFVKQTINNISVTQGTMLNVGLNEAYNVMKENPEYGQRQIMVISDGLAFDNGTSESGSAGSAQAIVSEMRADGISTSVI
ncbi:MAG: VWA domain-containing protein, partial [Clostridia bacterium]|nr:VWA domain-containing protein [Clostridia bacterium]